jgi:TRAP transporter TAXI family solute receptor
VRGNMKTWILVSIAGLAGVLIGAFAPLGDESNAPPPRTGDTFSIGGGWLTGNYYPAAGAICNQLQATEGFEEDCLVRPSHGSIENLQALREGLNSFAIVQSDWQFHAYHGTSLFEEEGAFTTLRSIMTLYGEAASLLVRPGVDAEDMNDLKGLRISIGEEGSGTAATWQAVAEAAGWSGADLAAAQKLGSLDAIAGLCAGDLDAIFWIVGHPSSVTLEVIERCGATLLPVHASAVDTLVEENPYFLKITLLADGYPGQTEAIETLGVGASLVTRQDVPAALVEGLTAAVLDDIDGFRAAHPALTGFGKASAIGGGLSAPLHDGAKSALEERGVR